MATSHWLESGTIKGRGTYFKNGRFTVITLGYKLLLYGNKNKVLFPVGSALFGYWNKLIMIFIVFAAYI